jgi:hypothetical protein
MDILKISTKYLFNILVWLDIFLLYQDTKTPSMLYHKP